MIRPADHADFPRMIEMVRAYREEVRPDLPFDLPAVSATLSRALYADDGLVLIASFPQPHGMLVASVGHGPWFADPVAEVLMWWIDPPMRGGREARALVEAFETWAASRGAFLAGVPVAGKSADAMLSRAGFRPGQSVMVKDLS